MKRFCFTCNLQNDPELIEEYKEHHKRNNIWPEVTKSIRDTGVINMEIYLVGDRLCMVMETKDDFELEKKEIMDASNPIVQEWERLMENFQKKPDFSEKSNKWVLMERIFELPD